MTQTEVTDMATQLLETYPSRPFEISMPDKESYDMMRDTLTRLGRSSGPDGEFYIVKVFASSISQSI